MAQVVIYALATGAQVAVNETPGYLWTPATLAQIYFCVADNEIVLCYPGMQPQIVVYAPATASFAFGPFTFRTITNQSQQPFYRAGNFGATTTYSAVSGAVTLTCSQPYFAASQVGLVLSILGQQVTITGVSSPTVAQAQVAGRLPDALAVTVASGAVFAASQIVEDSGAAFKMEVSSVAGNVVTGVLTSAIIYAATLPANDILESPLGASTISGTPQVLGSGTTLQWQEPFMGAGIGWPMACAYDKARLIFFDFPQKPGAILWSAISAYDTFWIDSGAATLQPDAGTNPQDAILEFLPSGPRVRHVVGSGDEFVFTDRGIFYVPLSANAPLKPGGVEFRRFSSDGVAPIVPIESNNAIVYINAGGKRATVIQRTGGYTTPYATMALPAMASRITAKASWPTLSLGSR